MNKLEFGRRMLLCGLSALLWLPSAWGQSGDLVAVVASGSKAPAKLSTEELSAIFMGSAKSFPNGERAVPIDQKAGSPAYANFYQKALGKNESQMRAYWSRIMFTGKGQPPRDVGDSEAVKKLVAANPNMVGYIEASLVDASVRVIADIK